MGSTISQSSNPIAALFQAVRALDRNLNQLAGRHPNLQVQGTNSVADGDGAVWLDNTDHTLHYVVNGNEYKLTGTLV
jgi:hypothetical protein